MSIRIMTAVTKYGPQNSSHRFVLLMIADNAADDGSNTFPSVETLAEKTALSERTVIRAINALVKDGYLVRRRRKDTSNIYQIVLEKLEPPVSDKLSPTVSDKLSPTQVTPRHLATCQDVTYASDTMSPDPSLLNHPINRQGGERAAVESRPAKASPPPLVKSQPIDRTPEGFKATQGYKPPTEPPPGNRQEPPAEVVAVGKLANAITEVTGVSAKLNWSDPKGDGVGDLANALHQAGYTAEQIRAHYGRNKIAERWNWYESDWRGKKGDRPRLKEIRETIAGAVADQPGKPQQESGQSWLEQSLRLARANGLLPQK